MDINRFFAIGINYKKTDASTRGLFSINAEEYLQVIKNARAAGIRELMVLSTCNRTEIYGTADSAETLASVLCSRTRGPLELFLDRSYIKQGHPAVDHLFAVAAGLDSQILGDYEIVGQIRQAARTARENGCAGPFLERMLNHVLKSSKAIKTRTQLSGGTVSVSFAAIQLIRDQVPCPEGKRILIAGTGKIGASTCRNILDYLPGIGPEQITVTNRSAEKAAELARQFGLRQRPFSELREAIADCDILIMATQAAGAIVNAGDLSDGRPRLVVDLSVPNNVDPAAGALPNITLVNVDGLSRINDETFRKREAEIPAAEAIIAEHRAEFNDWCDMRKNVTVLHVARQKLEGMQENADDDSIQKVINNMALRMRAQELPGCNFIEALHEYVRKVN